MLTKRGRMRSLYARDRFLTNLAQLWRDKLGLRITMGVKSPFVDFAILASEGVVDFLAGPNRRARRRKDKEAKRSAILNTLRKWAKQRAASGVKTGVKKT
jgi:hypothetical protein